MKLTRKKILEIHKTLLEFKGTYGKLFSMHLVLNLKKLKPIIEEIKVLHETSLPTEEYRKIQQEEKKLLSDYVERDETGKPIGDGTTFKIKKHLIDEYKTKHNEFIEKNKKIKDDYESAVEKVNELMLEEIEVDLLYIPFKAIPDEIDIKSLDILSDIISETDKELV